MGENRRLPREVPSPNHHLTTRIALASRRFLDELGPGLITGAADDDPSGISTYSVAGSVLWLCGSLDCTPFLSANGSGSTDVRTAWHGDRLWARQRDAGVCHCLHVCNCLFVLPRCQGRRAIWRNEEVEITHLGIMGRANYAAVGSETAQKPLTRHPNTRAGSQGMSGRRPSVVA